MRRASATILTALAILGGPAAHAAQDGPLRYRERQGDGPVLVVRHCPRTEDTWSTIKLRQYTGGRVVLACGRP